VDISATAVESAKAFLAESKSPAADKIEASPAIHRDNMMLKFLLCCQTIILVVLNFGQILAVNQPVAKRMVALKCCPFMRHLSDLFLARYIGADHLCRLLHV
jgi:exosortase/archaeosortase